VAKGFLSKIFMAIVLVIALASCNVSKRVPEGKHLLRKNQISIKNSDISRDEVAQFIRQNPNRRVLGVFPFYLWVYQKSDQGSETGFKNWLKNTIGEEPVYFDENLMKASQQQIELFLKDKGYFNSQVESSVSFKSNQARVEYKVVGNKPYTIRNLHFLIEDQAILAKVLSDTANSLIKKGQRYDANQLQDERNRLTRHLRNNGFFAFSNEFIFFDVDSALNNKQVDIFTRITNPGVASRDTLSSIPSKRHRKYIVDRVFVFPDFAPFRTLPELTDTTIFYPQRGNDKIAYYFVHENSLEISPKTISKNIHIIPGEFFDASKADLTYNFLNGLRNFRFINLQFQETSQATDSIGKLDLRIQLATHPVNSFTIEAEGFNTSGNQGLATNILYSNRNLFGGAERFGIRLKGATEMTIFGRRDEDGVKRFFHTFEFGAEASLEVPKLLAPLSLAKISSTARPLSSIKTGFSFRQRPSYTRYVLNAMQEYEWSETSRLRHFLSFLEISSIRISKDDAFNEWLESLNNPLLASRYRNHLIVGSRYSIIYNTQVPGKNTNFLFLRGNVELPSPFLFPANWLFGGENDEGQSTLLNRPYAQFFKTEFDIRYNKFFSEKNSFAVRLFTGVGVPFGKSEVLPFIKSFYSGGANSIRAWRIYTLGPGSSEAPDGLYFDRYGDIKLETNFEYRFPLYRFLRGALFVDAGNVWFINENKDFVGGEFKINRFLNEIAIGAGFGLRMDFQFFIIRIDAAVPVRDPSMPSGQRWVDDFKVFKNYNFNLGIGYPF
jgi:outer membrane translocation and assembly module TamA